MKMLLSLSEDRMLRQAPRVCMLSPCSSADRRALVSRRSLCRVSGCFQAEYLLLAVWNGVYLLMVLVLPDETEFLRFMTGALPEAGVKPNSVSRCTKVSGVVSMRMRGICTFHATNHLSSCSLLKHTVTAIIDGQSGLLQCLSQEVSHGDH